MKLVWKITGPDVVRVRALLARYKDDALVLDRIHRNVRTRDRSFTKEEAWHRMVMCLLSTQQRTGEGSQIAQFGDSVPFPLRYELCRRSDDLRVEAEEILTTFGGVRRAPTISGHLAKNLADLETGLWDQLLRRLHSLAPPGVTRDKERVVAQWVSRFGGFGAKQSRNLLQQLGLAQHEIPIDNRVARWLRQLAFPLQLSGPLLADEAYYCLALDGIQALCKSADVLPTILDAAMLASQDT